MERRRLFIAASLLLSILALLALELALRGIGLGGREPLFIEAPDLPGRLVASPDVMRRYLPGTAKLADKIEPILFWKEKPKGGYRIVVQGGSTAAGFPYGRWGGLAGMLGDRLETVFPDREVEVITTAMAAVNSYTLVDLADEIIEIRPDAVLVYAGHNEYLGILGPGSALDASTSPLQARVQLQLNRLGLYQGMQRLLFAAVSMGADARSLFAQAAEGARIPFDSEAYWAGSRQFETNLAELLEKYRRAGIPVYVGTLVSNEKDLPPFASGAGGDSADSWFARGRREFAAERFEAARDAFRTAKDRDEMRFRAPEIFDEKIRALARRHGATLVDVRRHFIAASPHGIVGSELMLEHVHPNADGYFLLAEAFYEALKQDGRIGDWSHAPRRDEARRDLPLTQIDRILAAYDMQELRAGFPFSDPPRAFALPAPDSETEQIAHDLRSGDLDWAHAMDALRALHLRAGRVIEAARVARLVAQAYPTERSPNVVAGRLLIETGRFALARRYLDRVLEIWPQDREARALRSRADPGSVSE